MNIAFPPFSQKLLAVAITTIVGSGVPFLANAVSVISMDGTTGTAGAVVIPASGTTYTINGATNGTINGSNLFFSFSQFGVGTGDTALFQCPSGCIGVTNVISRVTGGVSLVTLTPANPSNIQGTLTSTIGSANFWLFNPNGVGVTGTINVPVSASYFISNANRLNFSDGSFFGTGNPIPTGSTLSAATPSAFGFPTTQAVSTVAPPVTLSSATSQQVFPNDPITITYPSPIIIKGTNTTTPTPTPTPVSTPIPVTESPRPVPVTHSEPAPLAISEEGIITVTSTLVQPVVTIVVPPLPERLTPCGSDNKSSLLSKGIANYVPKVSSQSPYSLLGTEQITLTSQDPSLTSDESDDCL